MKGILKILKNNNKNLLNNIIFVIIYILVYHFFVLYFKINNVFDLMLDILLNNFLLLVSFLVLGRKYDNLKFDFRRFGIYMLVKFIYSFLIIRLNLIILSTFFNILLLYFDYLFLIKGFSIKNSIKFSGEIIRVTFSKLISIILFYSFSSMIILLLFLYIKGDLSKTIDKNEISRLFSLLTLLQTSTIIEIYNISFKKGANNG